MRFLFKNCTVLFIEKNTRTGIAVRSEKKSTVLRTVLPTALLRLIEQWPHFDYY
jgi:hypothetical protein